MIHMAEKGVDAGIDLAREILEYKGVSKYRLAKDLGVSDTQIYNWIRGVHAPSVKNYRKLKRYKDYLLDLNKVVKPDFTN